MTTPVPENSSIINGVHEFYDSYRTLAAKQAPNVSWPEFSELTGDQVSKWLLAYSSTIEVSVRITNAMQSLDIL